MLGEVTGRSFSHEDRGLWVMQKPGHHLPKLIGFLQERIVVALHKLDELGAGDALADLLRAPIRALHIVAPSNNEGPGRHIAQLVTEVEYRIILL